MYINKAILDKKPWPDLKFDKSIMNAITIDKYKNNKTKSILDMIDKNILVYISWPIISKKVVEVKSV